MRALRYECRCPLSANMLKRMPLPRRRATGKRGEPLHWMPLVIKGEAGPETARTALIEDEECSPIRPLVDRLNCNVFAMVTKTGEGMCRRSGVAG